MSELVKLTSLVGKRQQLDTSTDRKRDTESLDLDSIQEKLTSAQGKHYWRSLEELSNTEAFQELLHREFPSQASEWIDPVSRRNFLKLMGASLAFAGLTACTRQPKEIIAPYVRQPEDIVPGKPLFYATAMPLAGVATPLLVESHEGRPTKIEGNPDHPASFGATDVYSQASVLSLYDPDRSQTLAYLGDTRPWSSFLGAVRPALAAQRSIGGAGFRILSETVTSPTLANQIKTLLAGMPAAKWHQYDPAGSDNAREGARMAFGQYVNTIYRFDRAEVVLSLDSDFLSCGPAALRYSRDFMSRRKLEEGKAEMSRLYVVESTMTNTGAKADHRFPVRPGEIEAIARAVAAGLGAAGASGATAASHEREVAAIVRDLQQHKGKTIIIAGDYQPPIVHALAHAMNQALGNTGNTVVHTEPLEANPVDGTASLRELAQDIESGRVDLLLILGGNPVFTAPADLNFGDLLSNAENQIRIHLSLYVDETSDLCQWHIPETHYLESWSDARAFDGTVSIIQPLIAPLYRGKTAHEVLAAFTDQPELTSYEIVRNFWRGRMGAAIKGGSLGAATQTATTQTATTQTAAPQTASPSGGASGDFENMWRKALHDGFIANTALQPKPVASSGALASLPPAVPRAPSGSELEIIFRPDPAIYDGQFANNGWLQELPKPITTLTWDNAALMSPATAARLGIENKAGMIGGELLADRVELQYQGRSVVAPAFVLPGHADNCVTVHLGYGRRITGRVGMGTGFNAYAIRTSDAPWFGAGLTINKTGETYSLAVVQLHHLIDVDGLERRELVRSGTLEQYKENPSLKHGKGHHEKGHDELHTMSLYPEHEYEGNAWGMAIDLNSCVGCSACVVACQSENNIPVVGKDQVARGREMHWLRIDSYFRGQPDRPETVEAYFMPVPCMHCENAPCEVVCPVAATVHSADGLNDMVYNRCVGTRYCSNNCPYKVRRFNFLLYQDFETASLKMLRNPDVTVRSRGVMEKCTYCVQRIRKAQIEAEKEDRPVKDGEVVTACAAACPTQAIVFGDINDSGSRVAKLKHEQRNYALLADLNTQPRTTYLGAVRNPNPELEKA